MVSKTLNSRSNIILEICPYSQKVRILLNSSPTPHLSQTSADNAVLANPRNPAANAIMAIGKSSEWG